MASNMQWAMARRRLAASSCSPSAAPVVPSSPQNHLVCSGGQNHIRRMGATGGSGGRYYYRGGVGRTNNRHHPTRRYQSSSHHHYGGAGGGGGDGSRVVAARLLPTNGRNQGNNTMWKKHQHYDTTRLSPPPPITMMRSSPFSTTTLAKTAAAAAVMASQEPTLTRILGDVLLLSSGSRSIFSKRDAEESLYSMANDKGDDDRNDGRSDVLACSMIAQQPSFPGVKIIRRISSTIHRWIKRTYDTLLVLLRGAEIGLTLSPLVILIPASHLIRQIEDYYFYHYYLHFVGSSIGSSSTSSSSSSLGRRRTIAASTTTTEEEGQEQRRLSKHMIEAVWWYTLHAIQTLGPTFTKLSQWAGTRRDLFPPEICDRLSTLQSSTHVHSFHHTHRLLREAFGDDYSDRLLILGEGGGGSSSVIGSGCVAQVYRGELLLDDDDDDDVVVNDDDDDDGGTAVVKRRSRRRKPVAIKVLHPNIQKNIDRDIMFVRRTARLLDGLPFEVFKCLGLPRAAETFNDIMQSQVDLRIEGKNLHKFQSNFVQKGGGGGGGNNRRGRRHFDAEEGNAAFDYDGYEDEEEDGGGGVTVSFPTPVDGWVTENVLVEDLIVADVISSSSAGFDANSQSNVVYQYPHVEQQQRQGRRGTDGSRCSSGEQHHLHHEGGATSAAAAKACTTITRNDDGGQTMTTVSVMPISSFLKDTTEEGLQTRRELAKPLLVSFLKMVFQDNWVHGDIHPGNVFVKTTTKETISPPTRSLFAHIVVPWHLVLPGRGSNTTIFRRGTPTQQTPGQYTTMTKTSTQHEIILLDAGITTSLTPQGRRNLRDLFLAVVLNDGAKAGRLMVERARYERCSQTPGGVEAFAKGMDDIVTEFHDRRRNVGGLNLGAVRIGSLLARVLDLCRVHGVELDPSMASIVLSTLVLEGLGRSLEPDLNLMDFAIPFIMAARVDE